MPDFIPFPKVPRLSREMVLTEKLDGTNVSIWIDDFYHVPWRANQEEAKVVAAVPHSDPIPSSWLIRAGSRNRFITPDDDNFRFAAWVRDNAEELVKLGPGTHYGEWWGRGIQRGYGLDEKRFSLFNVGRWFDRHLVTDDPAADVIFVKEMNMNFAPSCCHVVPILYQGVFDSIAAEIKMRLLLSEGSWAAPGFMNPEGIMIYHTAARQYFKTTFEGDASGKGT